MYCSASRGESPNGGPPMTRQIQENDSSFLLPKILVKFVWGHP